MPDIYEPAEDSLLMSEALALELPGLLKLKPDLKLLEVGCGSGINLETAEQAGVEKENILGADINIEAVNHCKNLGFNSIRSDLFNNIKGKFDVIAFNPPYLPEDSKEPEDSRINTTAGEKGNELIIEFLKQAKGHLADDGVIFLITSSLSEEIDFNSSGYEENLLAEKKLFFETLFLWNLNKVE